MIKNFVIFIAVVMGNIIAQGRTIVEIRDNWFFSQAGMNKWLPAKVPGTVHTDLLNNKLIEDPFFRNNEKELQWIDKVNWEYQTVFNVSDSVISKNNISLFFKGLDTYAEVYLNDSLILNADNMFREWVVDCKSLIKKNGNVLRIYFTSPIFKGLKALEGWGYPLPAVNDQSENGGLGPNKVSVFTRKAPYSYGWDWGPRFVTSGIWRPIYLEAWDDVKISDIYIIQREINAKKADLTADIEIQAEKDVSCKIILTSNGKEIKSENIFIKKGKNTVKIDYAINNPKLWWCSGLGEPNLYNFSVGVNIEGRFVDKKTITTGLREIEVVQEPDADGRGRSFCFKINGLKIFAKGANYIPNDAFLTRVSNADYESIIKSAADANMNMIRLWGGGIYENDIFYELCDRYGILVWHDFMFACSMYPGNEDFLNSVRQEAIDNVRRVRNHPCIALWCGNNEIETAWAEGKEDWGWGWKNLYSSEQRKEIYEAYQKIFAQILPSVVKENTYNVFYWPSSPTAGNELASYESRSGDMHYWGVWHGLHPFEDFNKYLGRFMSEYGFQSFPEFKSVKNYTIPDDYDIESDVMAAHQRSGIGNLRIKQYMADWYKVPKDFHSFLYVSQILQAEAIKSAIYAHRRNMPYVMGSLYWQINDCWPVASWSSIDYYKRWKALHYYAKKAFNETIVIPYLNNDTVSIFVASDKQARVKANILLTLISFDGKEIKKETFPVVIEPNKGILAFQKNIDYFVNEKNLNNTLLLVELKDSKSNLIANDILYFVKPMNLNLKKPNISKKINSKNGKYEIILKSDVLAKNVFLSLENADGTFSDNYFDILPGREVIVTIDNTKGNLDIEKELQIFDLTSSY